MIFVSIDPGATVGLYWHDTGDDFGHMGLTLRSSGEECDFDSFISILLPRIQSYAADNLVTVLIEQAPGHGDIQQNLRVAKIDEVIALRKNTKIIHILPGEWKPYAKAQKIASQCPYRSRHVTDAFCMLKYFRMISRENNVDEYFA
jgi:hypothetical protein